MTPQRRYELVHSAYAALLEHVAAGALTDVPVRRLLSDLDATWTNDATARVLAADLFEFSRAAFSSVELAEDGEARDRARRLRVKGLARSLYEDLRLRSAEAGA